MAEKIADFPAQRVRTPKYPWHEWGNGEIWKLEQGSDFETSINSMRQAASKAAIQRGMKARTARVVEDGKEFLVLQFVSREPEPAKPAARKPEKKKTPAAA